MRSRLSAALFLGALALPLTLGCQGPATGAEAASTEPSHGPEEVELAVLMGEMQRHAAKLGYSIEGENVPLATFYLEEVTEVTGELHEIDSYDGFPVAEPTRIIMDPLLTPLADSIRAADWPAAGERYQALIDGCNRCHAATEHEFIEVLPATGQPPYAQRFTAR